MPTPPEVLDGVGHVRNVEVLGKSEPHEQSHADGHVGVAGEVGIDLDRVAVDPGQHVEGAVLARRLEGVVHHRSGQEVGDDHFLEHARPMSLTARATSLRSGRVSDFSWGMNSVARTMGPATSWGKKDR